jgi:Orsellinic acid/F9775 biosynthesis cluster protein D
VICRVCAYALQTTGDRVTKHLWEKHQVPKEMRHGLTPFIHSLRLPDPNKLDNRPDGSPPHPFLKKQIGAACRHCDFRSLSVDLVLRHVRKAHGQGGRSHGWARDDIQDRLHLQSWTLNGVRGYWIVNAVAENAEAEVPDRTQPSPRRRARVNDLHSAELRRVAQSEEGGGKKRWS